MYLNTAHISQLFTGLCADLCLYGKWLEVHIIDSGSIIKRMIVTAPNGRISKQFCLMSTEVRMLIRDGLDGRITDYGHLYIYIYYSATN